MNAFANKPVTVNPVVPNVSAWVVYCDGSAVPNPGRMGLGAVVVEPGGTVRHALSHTTTFTGCNNEAELRALALALQWLQARGAGATDALQVFSDSRVLIEQLGDARQRAAPIERLAVLVGSVRALLAPFKTTHLHWVPRHRNREADALARAAVGLAPKAAPAQRGKNKRKAIKKRTALL